MKILLANDRVQQAGSEGSARVRESNPHYFCASGILRCLACDVLADASRRNGLIPWCWTVSTLALAITTFRFDRFFGAFAPFAATNLGF